MSLLWTELCAAWTHPITHHPVLCFLLLDSDLGGARQTGCWCSVLSGLVRLSGGYLDSFLVTDWGVNMGYLGSIEMDDEVTGFCHSLAV